MRHQEIPIVFIVDGDDDHRSLYSARFKVSGYRVAVAKTGLQAVRVAKRSEPDIVIINVDLPDNDGFETLTTLRAAHPQVPIIVYTGYAHFRADVRCWVADAFMIHSSNAEALERKVRELLIRRTISTSFTLHRACELISGSDMYQHRRTMEENHGVRIH